jgi:hypothetical protein
MTYEEAVKACTADPYQCGYAWRLYTGYVSADRAWVIMVVNPCFNEFRPLYVFKGKAPSAADVLNALNESNSYRDLASMPDAYRDADDWECGTVQQLTSYVERGPQDELL